MATTTDTTLAGLHKPAKSTTTTTKSKGNSGFKEFLVAVLFTIWMAVVFVTYVGFGVWLVTVNHMNKDGQMPYFIGGFIIAALLVAAPLVVYLVITKDKRAAVRPKN